MSDPCERASMHDPHSTAEWRDSFFVDCSQYLMNPTHVATVAQQPWLNGFLRCIVTRINAEHPVLPARQCLAALQCLGALARPSVARPAVRAALLALGDRADELFHDKLQGIRSFDGTPGTAGDGGSPSASARSVVHNTFVVTLMRVEDYTIGASALLELVDSDVGALVGILLAVIKVHSYELGITTNALRVFEELTHPATYFQEQSSDGATEMDLSLFGAKLAELLKRWTAANALDTVLATLHRRAAQWNRRLSARQVRLLVDVDPSASLSSSASMSPPTSRNASGGGGTDCSLLLDDDDLEGGMRRFAGAIHALGRTVMNLVRFSTSPNLASTTTAVRQHVLVVQSAAATFAGLLTALAGTIAQPLSREQALHSQLSVSSALELLAVATRDVRRVPRPIRRSLLVALSAVIVVGPEGGDGGNPPSSKPLPPKLFVMAIVTLANADLLLGPEDAPATGDEAEDGDAALIEEARDLTRTLARVLQTVRPPPTSSRAQGTADGAGPLESWLALALAHPDLHHNRAIRAATALRACIGKDLDSTLQAALDVERALEAELAELQQEREKETTAAAAAAATAAATANTTPGQAPENTGTPSSAIASPSSTAAITTTSSGGVVRGTLLGELPTLGPRRTATAGTPSASVATPSTALPIDTKTTTLSSIVPAEQGVPEEFRCALRRTRMREPVRLPCGKHIDRGTMRSVLVDVGHIDPVTAKPLPNDFDPEAVDEELRARIGRWEFQTAIQGARL